MKSKYEMVHHKLQIEKEEFWHSTYKKLPKITKIIQFFIIINTLENIIDYIHQC